jgi:hypothetical protein
MNYKLYILKEDLKKRGLFCVFKKIILYLLHPVTNLIKRSRFLVSLRYGVLPNIYRNLFFYQSGPNFVKLPKSKLVEDIRRFWYTNIPGEFNLEGEKISRKDIFTYGGPNPKFTCPICQKVEWLSRVRQKNLFLAHSCPQTKECEELCKKQGDEFPSKF